MRKSNWTPSIVPREEDQNVLWQMIWAGLAGCVAGNRFRGRGSGHSIVHSAALRIVKKSAGCLEKPLIPPSAGGFIDISAMASNIAISGSIFP
jgi:hypothetical protein